MARLTGTAGANHIIGTASADTILGRGGSDILEGGGGNDTIDGGLGNDSLYGGDGTDWLSGGRGNDLLSGGAGNDTFVFGLGCGQDVVTDFTTGDIVQISGFSSAKAVTQVGADVVVTLSATDKITFSNASLATIQAALPFDGGTTGGGTTGSTINGTNNGEVLNGTAGNDIIHGLGGHDVINGGGGNDRIYGGLGGDDLSGGAGADAFVYSSLADAPPYGLFYWESDRILDFQSIDTIDLSAVDANAALAGAQSFQLSASAADTSAGSLHINVDSGYVWLSGYSDNSGYPTLFIDLTGGAVPTAANLIL